MSYGLHIEDAQEEIKEYLQEFLESNPDFEGVPCLLNDLDPSGTIHEIIDGTVPVYYADIRHVWNDYFWELQEVYENAGIGTNPLENSGMTAIYCYIEERIHAWYEENAEDIVDAWHKETKQLAKLEKGEL